MGHSHGPRIAKLGRRPHATNFPFQGGKCLKMFMQSYFFFVKEGQVFRSKDTCKRVYTCLPCLPFLVISIPRFLTSSSLLQHVLRGTNHICRRVMYSKASSPKSNESPATVSPWQRRHGHYCIYYFVSLASPLYCSFFAPALKLHV